MSLKTVLTTGAAVSALVLVMPAHAGTYVSLFGGYSALDGDSFSVGPFSYSNANLTYSRPFSDTDTTFSFNFPYAGKYARFSHISLSGTSKFYTVHRTTVGSFSEGDYDSGFVVGAAFGLQFDNGFRAELEASWRKANIGGRHTVTGSTIQFDRFVASTSFYGGDIFLYADPVPSPYEPIATLSTLNVYTRTSHSTASSAFAATAHTSGDVTAFSIMTNLWYDFDLGTSSPFTPFIGAGVGMADLQIDYSGHVTLPYTTAHFNTNADDWVVAWQLGAGLGYEFENGMMLSAQYRYFATGDASVAGHDVGISANEGLIALNIPLGN